VPRPARPHPRSRPVASPLRAEDGRALRASRSLRPHLRRRGASLDDERASLPVSLRDELGEAPLAHEARLDLPALNPSSFELREPGVAGLQSEPDNRRATAIGARRRRALRRLVHGFVLVSNQGPRTIRSSSSRRQRLQSRSDEPIVPAGSRAFIGTQDARGLDFVLVPRASVVFALDARASRAHAGALARARFWFSLYSKRRENLWIFYL